MPIVLDVDVATEKNERGDKIAEWQSFFFRRVAMNLLVEVRQHYLQFPFKSNQARVNRCKASRLELRICLSVSNDSSAALQNSLMHLTQVLAPRAARCKQSPIRSSSTRPISTSFSLGPDLI